LLEGEVSDRSTPDVSEWSADRQIEQIRRFILLRFYESPTHRDFWRVAESYRRLSDEEKHELDTYAEQVRDRLRAGGRTEVKGNLPALASLLNVAYPGHLYPPMTLLRRMGLQPGVLAWAVNWLEETSQCLDSYSA